jgi:hypothetical protein
LASFRVKGNPAPQEHTAGSGLRAISEFAVQD